MSSLSLSLVLAASLGSNGDGKISAASPGTDASPGRGPGLSARFSWADADGDGKLELASVSADGALQLLAGTGGDRFEDVSERYGLAGITDAALALWVDYDADGRLDLFVGARTGASWLFHNEGGAFVDMAAGAGLDVQGEVRSADWLDHDGDGRADLHVVTAKRHELYRALEGGFFERAELPLVGSLAGGSTVVLADAAPNASSVSGATSDNDKGSNGGASIPGAARGVRTGPNRVSPGSSSGTGGASPLIAYPTGCNSSIKDQANPSTCMQASTTPTLGKLYPLSTNLFVAVSGDVGIGTTSPGAKLHVAGTARVTDTLTLAPSGDLALDVNTGSIYKGGNLFIHTKGGVNNTAVGRDALWNVTGTASGNTAVGHLTLFSNTSSSNTAIGSGALYSNTTGNNNTASGNSALQNNTTGVYNTASGRAAMMYSTIGNWNTATGGWALLNNSSGSYNTASGGRALSSNSTGASNTATGHQALQSNSTGSFNTATGAGALQNNTTASENVANGHSALFSNTTGSWNTASGFEALRSNTTGSSNTASGTIALRDNTTGARNTATGFSTLRHNTTGNENTANGQSALLFNTTGSWNTATGSNALSFNTSGALNTATGTGALSRNTIGTVNTATGVSALYQNTTGYHNTATGGGALASNTTGIRNLAVGMQAGATLTTGSNNIAVGHRAGYNLTTGSNNIAIGNLAVAGEAQTIRVGTAGTHTRAFIAGIRGVTTGVANAIPVLVDSNGQLGTISSSRRFKEEIRDMDDATEQLLALRPVTFRYKPEVQQGERPLEYGLIAEEVAEVFPDLVVYDEDGKPFTVKYHLLSSMLLNELQRLSEAHGHELADLRERLAALEGENRAATSAAVAAGAAVR